MPWSGQNLPFHALSLPLHLRLPLCAREWAGLSPPDWHALTRHPEESDRGDMRPGSAGTAANAALGQEQGTPPARGPHVRPELAS